MATTNRTAPDEGYPPAPDAGEAPASRGALHRLIEALPDASLAEAARRLDDLLAVGEEATPEEHALLNRWIVPDPARGAHRATLAGSHVPVYALVGQLDAYAGDPDPVGRVASDYAVPQEAVEAALRYYRRHRTAIDAWVTLNAAE